MHLLDGEVVNFRFGFGEASENPTGAVRGAWREFGVFDPAENDRKAAVMMAFGSRDLYVSRGTLPALHLFRANRPAFEAQLAQFGFDRTQIRAGVHQRSQHHVAADAGKKIEVCDAW